MVNSKLVEDFLKAYSLVPTEVVFSSFFSMVDSLYLFSQSAFSERLSHLGFDMFCIFLVDFMHEFELGIWKKIFIHLLRILDCVIGAVNTMDQR